MQSSKTITHQKYNQNLAENVLFKSFFYKKKLMEVQKINNYLCESKIETGETKIKNLFFLFI